MRVKVEIDEALTDIEVVIKCPKINESVNLISQKLLDISPEVPNILFYKDDKEYYLEVNEMLFFETEDSNTYAHTKGSAYMTKYRLYELEEILPKYFVRVSKSTIVNVNHILAMSSSFGTSYALEFNKTHKQVYVSRRYKKILKERLEERKNYEK